MVKAILKQWLSERNYALIKYPEITGRYVTNTDLKKAIKDFDKVAQISQIGSSVKQEPIYQLKIGTGEIKIFAWSQMHGNESTTTKAIFDILNAFKLQEQDDLLKMILKKCSIYIIPILNPDGAFAYTRVNYNNTDLNRDMQDLSQPESIVLKEQYDAIKPDYCLNLHDQRTIFSAGPVEKSAIVSFLTPSRDAERTIDDTRKRSMAIIAGMAEDLSLDIPGHIGRYDDGFNLNCAGDTFQNLLTPTILFEAGHYPGDYQREKTRKYIFKALLSCIHQITTNRFGDYSKYFEIPENDKLFYDIIIRNASVNNATKDVAIQYRETLMKKQIEFVPVIAEVAAKITKYGHQEIDAKGGKLELAGKHEIIENVVVDKIILNTEYLEFKSQ